MYLEVTPSGGKYWRLKYRFNGKEKKLSVGIYPEVSLADARERRFFARKQLASGIDPSEAKQEQKRTALMNVANTFESVAREWHVHKTKGCSTKHATGLLHRLELDIFPEIGHRPIASITAHQVLDALRKIEKRGAHEIARRARQICGQVFRYAIVTDRAERNPIPDLQGALEPYRQGHYAALEANDLPEFLAAMERNDGRLYMPTRCATRLLLLTFVRTSELIEAKWGEINLGSAEWVKGELSEFITVIFVIVARNRQPQLFKQSPIGIAAGFFRMFRFNGLKSINAKVVIKRELIEGEDHMRGFSKRAIFAA
jgi:integrase